MTLRIWEVKEGTVTMVKYSSEKDNKLIMLKTPVPLHEQHILNDLNKALDMIEKYVGSVVKIEEEQKVIQEVHEEKEEIVSESTKKRKYPISDKILMLLRNEIKEDTVFGLMDVSKICNVPYYNVSGYIKVLMKSGDIIKVRTGKYKLVPERKQNPEDMLKYNQDLMR